MCKDVIKNENNWTKKKPFQHGTKNLVSKDVNENKNTINVRCNNKKNEITNNKMLKIKHFDRWLL